MLFRGLLFDDASVRQNAFVRAGARGWEVVEPCIIVAVFGDVVHVVAVRYLQVGLPWKGIYHFVEYEPKE